ncbi:unnamed protein product [Citrullus colocynthis]|uniref:Uncharacterized protein n=1 Tax=Citrullus colocynthis TaxID=252529 RepID=A0ABP0Y8P3_9ROSI
MDFKDELNTQVAEEEDSYYAEIRKQIILLLTAYDDDDEIKQIPKTAAKQSTEGVFIPRAVKYKKYCVFRRMRKHERKEKHRQKNNKT